MFLVWELYLEPALGLGSYPTSHIAMQEPTGYHTLCLLSWK